MRLRLPARRFALSVSIVPMLHATAVMAQALPVSPPNPSVPASQTDTNRLDPVNVTATRIPSRVSDTIAETTVIDRTDIDRATGRTFTELLSRQPGIQFTNTGGLGQFSSVYIRGMRAQSTLLLVDGVPMGDVDFNLPSMSNIPLDSIDRVEIVRGPLSSLYGSQAMGGVIQVFTRQAREGFSPNASATVGSNQYYQISGGAAFGQGPFNGAVQLSRVSTNAFSAAAPNEAFGYYNPDRDPFIQNSGNLRLGWQLNADWRIEGSAMSAQATRHIDDGPDVDSKQKITNAVQTLALNGKLADNWRTRLSVGWSSDTREALATANPYEYPGKFKSDQRQYTWENTTLTPLGTAMVLLERTTQTLTQPVQLYAVTQRNIDGLGVGLTGEAEQHSWQTAVRRDVNSQFGGQTTGSIGYGYALTPQWRLGASYGTSFVAPSFADLYYPGYSNPNLAPEQGKSTELSLRWASGGQSLRTAWVDTRIQNAIVLDADFLPVNVGTAKIDGLVMAWQGNWPTVLASASYENLNPRNTTSGDSYNGNQLPGRARQALRGSIDWMVSVFSIGGTVSAWSSRYSDLANTYEVGGFTTIDLRADYPIDKAWTVGVRLNNLTEKTYQTVYGYNQPGREGFLTLRWQPR